MKAGIKFFTESLNHLKWDARLLRSFWHRCSFNWMNLNLGLLNWNSKKELVRVLKLGISSNGVILSEGEGNNEFMVAFGATVWIRSTPVGCLSLMENLRNRKRLLIANWLNSVWAPGKPLHHFLRTWRGLTFFLRDILVYMESLRVAISSFCDSRYQSDFSGPISNVSTRTHSNHVKGSRIVVQKIIRWIFFKEMK